MEKSGFIVKFYDKTYEDKSIEELCKAPVSAISGVSESDAVVLKTAFRIKTVEDLAANKYVRLAQGINRLSGCSVQILDKTFESKAYENLAKKPVSAMSGISMKMLPFSRESLELIPLRKWLKTSTF